MYCPLTGAFMNVSAVTLRLLLIITAYMDDLLHEDTNIFFLSITRIFFLVPNYRIIEFQSHGVSRTVTDFLFLLFLSRIIEFSNFVFTRNIADGHGFSFLSRIFFFLVPNYRIIEFQSHGISRTVTGFFLVPNYRIIEFYLSCPETVLGPETCPWTH